MTLELSREQLEEASDRYHRQTLIQWWDQDRVASAKVLVIGAGALGNEILKLLSLIGVGRTLVFDLDDIEQSNLSRCVLFRDSDEGRRKAHVAAERMRELNPDIRAQGRDDNIITHTGLGAFHWADVVIAGVDNREARVFVNSACARVGKIWVDGAIEGFAGVVRVFDPATTACYECTMNAIDRKLLAERRSCAMLARDVVARGHVPTTAVAASVVGALQVQEAVKLLHDQPGLRGEGIHIQGMWSEFSRVRYQQRDDCPGHDSGGEVIALGCGVGDITAGELLQRAEDELGPGAVVDLSRDIVVELSCPECGASEPGGVALGALRERDARCPECGTHRIVDTTATLSRDGRCDLTRTMEDLGVPPFDLVFPRQELDSPHAWLFDGDAESALGAVAGPVAEIVRDNAPSSPSGLLQTGVESPPGDPTGLPVGATERLT